jgi:hypothetical protein
VADVLQVEQVDRDAAANYTAKYPTDDATFSFEMRQGAADNHSLVQAFVSHRIAAQAEIVEQAARLCESAAAQWDRTDMGHHIASSYRRTAEYISALSRAGKSS